MSTAPVTTAPVKETATQKVESFFTKFGEILKDIPNVIVNVAEEEETPILSILPSNLQPGVAKLISFAAAQVAAVDAKYAAIGASNVSFAQKVAEAVATGGVGALAIAAEEGVMITGTVNSIFAASATITSSLNLSGITAAPTVPAPTPAA
jgi:hypothetical protein